MPRNGANKVVSDPKSRSIEAIICHELLSERRFFGEFLGTPEPAPNLDLPTDKTPTTERTSPLING